jgi:type VI secretion system protein ImpM
MSIQDTDTPDHIGEGEGPAQPKLVGWFGKIPALGDFITRRLPPSFVQRWDDWLANEIYDAQHALGSDWPGIYLAGSLWCFELAPGTVDADRWRGVVLPSVDRVGRRFPLTVAASGAASPAHSIRWWAAMADAARCAQDPDCDAQGLDDRLETNFEAQERAPHALPVECTGLDAMIRSGPAAGSLWWRWPEGELAAPRPAFVVAGLPHGADFLRMFRAGPQAAGDG